MINFDDLNFEGMSEALRIRFRFGYGPGGGEGRDRFGLRCRTEGAFVFRIINAEDLGCFFGFREMNSCSSSLFNSFSVSDSSQLKYSLSGTSVSAVAFHSLRGKTWFMSKSFSQSMKND